MFVAGYLPSVLPLYLILFGIGVHCSLKPGKKGVSKTKVVSFMDTVEILVRKLLFSYTTA